MKLVRNAENAIELKKHINAIHCTNNLTLVQRKLFNALLFRAYSDLPYKQTFQIPAKQLCTLIGYNSNDYSKLKKALLALTSIAIEWNVIDSSTGNEKAWKASSMLASAELEGGLCRYEYSQVMKEFLYQPEIYGRINMILVAKFKSNYGLALYENCIRYQGLPQTPWFTLDVFRKLMGVFGDKYSAFNDFKKRVLNIAVAEVNAVSPIKVTAEIERKNQKTTRVRFKLLKKTTKLPQDQLPNIINDGLFKVLSETFGLSEKLIFESINEYGQDYIKEKVDIILQSESFLSGKIRALAGYLVEALRRDYKLSQSSQTVLHTKKKQQKIRQKELEKKQDVGKEKYSQYVNQQISAYIDKLSDESHEKLLHDFESSLTEEGGLALSWYKKHGNEHPAVKAFFTNFVKESRAECMGQLLSFEEFLSIEELEYQK